jgi:hypothetical protein
MRRSSVPRLTKARPLGAGVSIFSVVMAMMKATDTNIIVCCSDVYSMASGLENNLEILWTRHRFVIYFG